MVGKKRNSGPHLGLRVGQLQRRQAMTRGSEKCHCVEGTEGGNTTSKKTIVEVNIQQNITAGMRH